MLDAATGPEPVDELDELVAEFLSEAGDSADQLERDVVALERDPTSRELQAAIFRAVHTIKGTSSLLGFERVSALAHGTETLLVRLREGRGSVSDEVVEVLLGTVDALRRMLAAVASSGTDDGVDVTALAARTQALADASPEEPAAQHERPLGAVLVQSGLASAEAVGAALAAQLSGDNRPLGEILVATGAVARETLDQVLGQQRRRAVDRSIKVDPDLLDHLLGLVGDLAATRDQLAGVIGTAAAGDLRRAVHRLDLVTRELAAGVAATRTQRVDQLWSKLPRLVRDLAAQCGKRVELQTAGGGTEVDRTLLDGVRDPLTHLLRNAVDHGVEPPEQRLLAGKPADGRLLLRAHREHAELVLEVSDDGVGIDPARVGDLAVARGLLDARRLAELAPEQVQQLVLAPGFSTAAAVTSVSGRGVGMDVVRSNVEGLGGTVELESVPGHGTTWRLRLPLAGTGADVRSAALGGVPQPADVAVAS